MINKLFDDLIKEYDDYLKFIDNGISGAISTAFAHGWCCPQNIIDEGEVRRAKIKELKERIEQLKTNEGSK